MRLTVASWTVEGFLRDRRQFSQAMRPQADPRVPDLRLPRPVPQPEAWPERQPSGARRIPEST